MGTFSISASIRIITRTTTPISIDTPICNYKAYQGVANGQNHTTRWRAIY
jgi:hypothetical protein